MTPAELARFAAARQAPKAVIGYDLTTPVVDDLEVERPVPSESHATAACPPVAVSVVHRLTRDPKGGHLDRGRKSVEVAVGLYGHLQGDITPRARAGRAEPRRLLCQRAHEAELVE